jgi:hypothetical protein
VLCGASLLAQEFPRRTLIELHRLVLAERRPLLTRTQGEAGGDGGQLFAARHLLVTESCRENLTNRGNERRAAGQEDAIEVARREAGRASGD